MISSLLHICAAVIWPKYCRYGVKHYIINQLINIYVYSNVSYIAMHITFGLIVHKTVVMIGVI